MKKKHETCLAKNFYAWLRKNLKIMKCLVLLFFLGIGNISASVYSQAGKFDLVLDQVTLKEAFDRIEKVSNYKFLYRSDLINTNIVKSIDVEEKTLDEVLTSLLADTKLGYSILENNMIVVAPIQQARVTGTVTDASTGEVLPGVNILIKGTTSGVVSDLNGKFSIETQEGAVLVFQYVGYIKQEVEVGKQMNIDVALAPDVQSLDEVVVVGYGTQKKSLVTGAIAKVDGEEMVKTASLRVNQALQGKTAGVVITNNSGQPGEFVSVRVRGAGTIGDNEPLYIVDGLPTNGYGIDYLNGSDIESIEVLKDAASAAIYGARGANGVVLITTKQGKKGEKFTVNYDMYYGIQNPWNKIDMLNAQEYMDIMNEADTISTGKTKISFPQDRKDTLLFDTDWQEEMFYRDAPKQSHVVSFTGGTDKSTYSSSFSYFNQDGIVAKGNSNFERYTFRSNNTREFGMLTLGTNVNLALIKSKGIGANDSFDGSSLVQALNLPPIVPVKFASGKWGAPEDYKLGLQEISNPVALLSYRHNLSTTHKLVGNVYANFDFGHLFPVLKGLYFKSSYNQEFTLVNDRSYNPLYNIDTNHKNIADNVNENDRQYSTWNVDNTLTYSKILDKHSFTLLAGHTAYKSTYENIWAQKGSLIFSDFEHAYLANATDPLSAQADGTFTEHTLLSYFGRLDYNYDEKYMMTATLRKDGSSRFGPSNKFGYFPSVSVGWVISKENFFPQSDLISFLKIRGSWGRNGNESIGDFTYSAIMSNSQIYYFGLDQTQVNGNQPSKIPNPNVKWETSQQSNIAFDLGLLKNRITLTVDLYDKKTKDWLVDAPAPLLSGNLPPTINGGEIQNKGIESELGFKTKAGDFNFDIKLTGAFNVNKVLEIKNSEKIISGGGGGFGHGTIQLARVGEPIGYFWAYKTGGIFQTKEDVQNHFTIDSLGNKHVLQSGAKPGDVIFEDINKDGTLDDKDKVNVGNPNPDFTGGLNFSVEWKGLDLNMFWYTALGQQTWMVLRRYDQVTANYSKELVDGRWTGPGTSNRYPRVSKADANFNGNWKTPSDLFVYDSDYARLRNLTLGYTLPSKITNIIRIAKIRVYVQGENLITLTKYPGFDPEIGGDPLHQGVDRGVYPQAKTYIAGLNVTF